MDDVITGAVFVESLGEGHGWISLGWDNNDDGSEFIVSFILVFNNVLLNSIRRTNLALSIVLV